MYDCLPTTENFHAGHVTGYEAQVFGWLLSGFTSHSKVIKSLHLKDWRSQGLNHLPSITNLAYAKPFLKLSQIQEKRANVVHQRIPHLITCIYGMEALRLTPAKTFCIQPLASRVMASVIQNSKGVLLIDYNISPERFKWAYCPDLMRHLRLAVKEN